MFNQNNTDPATKKAAIDWLLTHGETVGDGASYVLAAFKVHGVDYERSEMPEFGPFYVGRDNDEFGPTDRGYIQAVHARIMPVGGKEYYADVEFVISPQVWNTLIFQVLLAGAITAGSDEQAWQDRANPQWVERVEAEIASEAEYQRLRAERDKRA